MAKVIGRGKITVAEVHDGIDGKNTYTHIRYSDDGGKTFTAPLPTAPVLVTQDNLTDVIADIQKLYPSAKTVIERGQAFSEAQNVGYTAVGHREKWSVLPSGQKGMQLVLHVKTTDTNRYVLCVYEYEKDMVNPTAEGLSIFQYLDNIGTTPGAWMGVAVSDKPYPPMRAEDFSWNKVQPLKTFFRYSDYDFTKIGGSPRDLFSYVRNYDNSGKGLRIANNVARDNVTTEFGNIHVPSSVKRIKVTLDFVWENVTKSSGYTGLQGYTNYLFSDWDLGTKFFSQYRNGILRWTLVKDVTGRNSIRLGTRIDYTDGNLYIKNVTAHETEEAAGNQAQYELIASDNSSTLIAVPENDSYIFSVESLGLKESQVNPYRNLFSLKKSGLWAKIIDGVITRKAGENQIRIFKLGLTETSAIDISVSFDAKSNAENQTLTCDCGDSGYQAITIGTEYKHFELHFHTNRYFVSPYWGFIDFEPKDYTKETYIKNVKVCRGTSTGNYSPAPEDEDVVWPILHEDANHLYVGTMIGDEPSDNVFDYRWSKFVGEDAYQIISNPATLVFDTNDKGIVTAASLSANKATILINKGGVDTMPEKVEIDVAGNKFCNASVSGNVISVTSININNTTHYSEGLGHVSIKATLDGRTFYAKIPWAVNLHAVTANLKTNQDSIVASVSSLSKTVEGNKKTVDTNLATLDGKIEARVKQTDYDAKTKTLTDSIAQARTKADEIELSVKKKTVGGANMLKGSSLRWTSVKIKDDYTKTIYTRQRDANIVVDRYDGDYVYAHNKKDYIWVSVKNQTANVFKGCFFVAHIEQGQEYTASVWIKSSVPSEAALETIISDTIDARTNPVNYCVYGENSQVAKWQRLQYTFTAPKTGWVEVNVWQLKNGELYISEVQLEEGNTATSWQDPDLEEQMAAISLKADNIKLGLKKTGIDIDEEAVSVIADKFRVKASNGTPIAVFKIGADGNPVLQAPYIDVDNLTVKKIEGATGTFREIYAVDGEMPNHPELGKRMTLTASLISFKSRNVMAKFGLGTLPYSSGFSDIPLCLDVNNDGGSAIGAFVSAVTAIRKYDSSPALSGAHALYITNGDIVGFRLYTKRSASSMTLTKMDSVIIDVSSGSDSTYTLPSGCEDGQMYFLFSSRRRINIKPSGGDQIDFKDYTTSTYADPWDLTILVYDSFNRKWHTRFIRQT